MSEVANTRQALDRLVPELADEVRRNLIFWLVGAPVLMAVICGGLAVVADPGGSGAGARVGLALSVPLLAFAVTLVADLWALAYIYDCWPAFLRRRFLMSRCGIQPSELYGLGWLRHLRFPGFWLAFLRGAIVGWAFVALSVLAASAVWEQSPPRFVGPALVLVVISGQIAAYAWVVRQVVGAVPRM
jgi:hypothetical protein